MSTALSVRLTVASMLAMTVIVVSAPRVNAQVSFEHVSTIPGPADLVQVEGTQAFVTHHREFKVFDLSNPTMPRQTGLLTMPEEIWKFSINGERAYVGANFHGLSILDISDPTAPVELGAFASLGQTKIGAVYDTKVAYIDHMEGLVLIDVANESEPQQIGSYFLDGYARDVVTSGPIAYATDSPTGLYVFDLTQEGSPEPIGILHAPSAPRNALQVTELVDGRKLLAGIGQGGLQVYDVTDPAAPVKTSTFDTPGRANGLALQDQFAFVSAGDAGLQVIDLSDPSSPEIISALSTPRPARDVAVSDSLVLVVVGQGENEGNEREILVIEIQE